MSRRLFLWLFAVLPLAGSFFVPNLGAQTLKPIRITILGDSIDADEPPARPIQGWGTYLQPRFANASVTNLALSGRSTKTYLYGDLDKQGVRGEPKYWNRAKVTPADFWIIKFGGNDSHSPPEDKHTEPAEYATNLKTIIKTARQLGITPILCTPFRRPFKKDALTNELDPYADAARQVAADEHVALIDVYAHATEWFTSLGPDKLTAYMPTDLGGHMNRAGAELMAEWMARQLVPIIPELKLAPPSAAAGN